MKRTNTNHKASNRARSEDDGLLANMARTLGSAMGAVAATASRMVGEEAKPVAKFRSKAAHGSGERPLKRKQMKPRGSTVQKKRRAA